MKSLREHRTRNIYTKDGLYAARIPFMVTGEYGKLNKRPHWHVLLFNYEPEDKKYLRTTDRNETCYTSEEINSFWKKGKHEFGSVTLESAGYVARYGAKALVHKDESDLFKPLHNTSKQYVLGKSWITQHYEHTFKMGYVLLPDENRGYAPGPIPRYYVDWAKKYQPDAWYHYVTEVRPQIIEQSEAKYRKEEMEYLSNYLALTPGTNFRVPLTRAKVKETILKSKFKQLQENLKL